MKKLLTILAIVFFAAQAGAQTMEYLQQKEFQTEKKKIYDGINASRKQLTEVKKDDAKIALALDSIKQILEMNAVQLFSNNDSLTKTITRVNALKEEFDSRKSLSQSTLILLFILIFVLFLAGFILLFQVKNNAAANHLQIVDLDKKTNEKFDLEVVNLKNDLQTYRDAIHAISAELNHKITSGFIAHDAKNQQLEKQLGENVAGIQEKLLTLKREADLAQQGYAGRAAKLEEEFKLLKEKSIATPPRPIS